MHGIVLTENTLHKHSGVRLEDLTFADGPNPWHESTDHIRWDIRLARRRVRFGCGHSVVLRPFWRTL